MTRTSGFSTIEKTALYVGFTRNLYRKPAYGRRTFPQLRTHRTYTTAFSKDLVHWSHPRQVLAPDRDDSMDAEFETILGFCYEGLYLAVLGVNRRMDGFGNASDNQLAYSRDGLHWERMSERKSFMVPDPDAGWEELTNQPSCFVVRDDRIYIYYTGFTLRGDHACESIGLATLRLDGFVSLDGIKRKGEPSKGVPYQSTLLTRPLWSTGNRLVVNAVNERVYHSGIDRSGRSRHPRIRAGRLRRIYGRQHPSMLSPGRGERILAGAFRCGSGSGCETQGSTPFRCWTEGSFWFSGFWFLVSGFWFLVHIK